MSVGVPSARDEKRRRWSIVLAGGEGRRMVRWIEDLNGAPRPKQYCSFTGSRTMLQHTLDRAVQVADGHHVVTVIGRGHRRFLPDNGSADFPGRVIEQPADRGTAGGVLLPATYVRQRDPEATVLILPSDHFIYPDHRFRAHVAHACRLAETFEDRFVLLGAIAAGPETDYGWILPEPRRILPVLGSGYPVWPVAGFREKPAPHEAASLFRAGGLWNTLVVAVKVKTLWAAAARLLPGMIERFEFLHRVLRSVRNGTLDREREAEVLQDIYLDMEPADFSREVLQYVASSTVVQGMEDVQWSDWGRPDRVEETLKLLGRRRPPARPAAAWLQPAEKGEGGIPEGLALPTQIERGHENALPGEAPGSAAAGL
jgi:mannose-1-phosphate guanylyltransferase